MNERKIITKGRPSIERLQKNETKVFYSTLLSCVIEFYKDKANSAKEKIITE